VQISARSDYAVRAMLVLAAREPDTTSTETLAVAQDLPRKFLEAILSDLRRHGLVRSLRGAEGGYRLARRASDIRLGEVLRAVDGPLAAVRGVRPEDVEYKGPAEHLREVWVAARASLREVLDRVTLADVVAGELPPHLLDLVSPPESWSRR
jgi:Rrf2 family protein